VRAPPKAQSMSGPHAPRGVRDFEDGEWHDDGRGLHSSTSQLNLSRVCHKKTAYTP